MRGGGRAIKAIIFRATDRWILKKTVKHMAMSEQYTQSLHTNARFAQETRSLLAPAL